MHGGAGPAQDGVDLGHGLPVQLPEGLLLQAQAADAVVQQPGKGHRVGRVVAVKGVVDVEQNCFRLHYILSRLRSKQENPGIAAGAFPGARHSRILSLC